ncbi:MAG: SDR family NAD(P)-dependent oxidoreductase [Gemmatimonadota bacterium]
MNAPHSSNPVFWRSPVFLTSVLLTVLAGCRPSGQSEPLQESVLQDSLAHSTREARVQPTYGQEPAAGQPVVLITGSTDGLGREVAMQLAELGHHVVVHGRNEERGREVVDAIHASGEGSARLYLADLASLEEVRQLGRAILADYPELDLLINNAGVGPGAPGHERVITGDGLELRFQVNYLSHYLLTRLLLPRLVESAPARIVNVSSRGQAEVVFDDLNLDSGYSGGLAYRRSKLAQIIFTFDLNEELEGTGVTVFAVHPAPVMATALVAEVGVEPQTTVEDGARGVMLAATTPGLEGGQYFHETEAARAHEQAYDEAARTRLREISESLTGLH